MTFNGTLGHQTYKHNNDALVHGVEGSARRTTSAAGSTPARTCKGTDAEHDLYTVKGKDWSKTRLVGFVTYSF